MRAGFAMTVEAAFSFLLLFLAASALLLFRLPKHDSQAFYLCSDAAIVLAKSSAFSGSLQESLGQASRLSGLCLRAEVEGAAFSSCPEGKSEGRERISLEIPVWGGLYVENAKISCTRPA
jgi:hypothetical protein